jgi:hypothetical protein
MNRWSPPAQALDHPLTHSAQYSRWTKKPRQCTDAIHRRPVGLSGAGDFSLVVVLYVLSITIGWTAESTSKHRFIRCWSNCFGASLYDLNATVGWTVGQGFGSSGAGRCWALTNLCCQTLRRRMNRCLYRRFIRRSVLNPLSTEFIRRV